MAVIAGVLEVVSVVSSLIILVIINPKSIARSVSRADCDVNRNREVGA